MRREGQEGRLVVRARNRPARRIVSRGSTRYVAPRSADWLSPKLFRSELSAYTSPVME